MQSLVNMKLPLPVYWTAAAVFAGAVSLKVVFPLSKIVFIHLIAKRYRSKRWLLKGAGEWAIVTGGSAGIGKGFAFELAKEGLNILVISNDDQGLNETCKEIEDAFPVKTKKLCVDFTKTDVYDHIKEVIDGLSTIACLVNNVGVFHINNDLIIGEPEIDWKTLIGDTTCNCLPVVCMTRIVLRKMLKQTSPGRTVINISSYAATTCIPLFLVYSATKAFVLRFSDCLAADLESSGILVQSYMPHIVATALTKAKLSWHVPDPATYAKSALDMLGVEWHSRGYFPHDLYTLSMTFIPNRIYRRMCLRKLSEAFPAQNISMS